MTSADEQPQIRCLCLDVDGVLTDGIVWVDDEGRGARRFHVHDGFAIKCFQGQGGRVMICSGKRSAAVAARMEELGITDVIQDSRDKLTDVQAVLRTLGLSLSELAVMGDDLPDIPLMRACAMPIAVANAVDEVKSVARLVTKRPGGQGAVREAIEWLMKSSGHWPRVLSRYGATPGPAAGGQDTVPDGS